MESYNIPTSNNKITDTRELGNLILDFLKTIGFDVIFLFSFSIEQDHLILNCCPIVKTKELEDI